MPLANVTDPDHGLTTSQVEQRRAAGEVNAVELTTSRPLRDIIAANVFTRFNALLLTLFALVLATGRVGDSLFGWAAILNSVFGIAQEWSAKRKLDSLAVLHTPTVRVVRDGHSQQIAVGEVVRGEIIELVAGDQVPADGEVVSGDTLELDESNLTGESDPVHRRVGESLASGTIVVAGSGRFRADVVGDDTQANTLAASARKFSRSFSDVQDSTNRLLRYLTWVVVIALPITVWAQTVAARDTGGGWRDIVVRSAGALVGLIPEGLVLLTTLAFVLAAVQLTRRQALIQELPAVEGLARVDVICVDKTGTLTHGDITFDRLEPVDQAVTTGDVRTALAALAYGPDVNATAKALQAAFEDPRIPVTQSVPFSSARKWSAVKLSSSSWWVLGAPDILAENYLAASRHAVSGDRVLAFGTASSADESGVHNFSLISLVILTERVRDDAAHTLRYFAQQGVDVKVISGDNPRTVGAIATTVGLDGSAPVDARTLPDDIDQLANIAEKTVVFGRVTPHQKRSLVAALQAKGHTVAMTGDGVNDVLALKDSDLGVAMGNAAPASKAVAQLVLLDGRFANLPPVVAEGRRLIANVERVANLFVAKNVMAAVAIVATAVAGLAFPFLPRQLTLMSTLSIGIPAAILALGPNTRRYVPGFLPRVLSLAIPSGLAAGAVSFLAFWYAPQTGATTVEQRGTFALIALLVVSFWLLSALARPYLLWKITLLATMVGSAVLAFIVPVATKFFILDYQVADIPVALAIGAVGAVVVEVAYRITIRRHLQDHPH